MLKIGEIIIRIINNLKETLLYISKVIIKTVDAMTFMPFNNTIDSLIS